MFIRELKECEGRKAKGRGGEGEREVKREEREREVKRREQGLTRMTTSRMLLIDLSAAINLMYNLAEEGSNCQAI